MKNILKIGTCMYIIRSKKKKKRKGKETQSDQEGV